MSTSPGDAVGLDTLCEARTRVVSGGADDPPQDIKLKLATTRTPGKRADFFKRQAPNYRKTRDLCAKYGIIAERQSHTPFPLYRLSKALSILPLGCKNRRSSCILT
jgi:hypothetical protein